MKRVFAFGTFDGVHAGHRSYLRQAREYGDHLTIVIARDATVERLRRRRAALTEEQRRRIVEGTGLADRIILGGTGDPLDIFRRERIDVAVLGFDQKTSEAAVAQAARRAGQSTTVVRARPYVPMLFQNHTLKKLGLIGRLLRKTT